MVRVTLWKTTAAQYCGYRFEGHALYTKDGSFDPVCCALSTLAIFCANAITENLSVSADCKYEEGYFELRLPSIEEGTQASEHIAFLLHSLAQNLWQLQAQYPENITIHEEVRA